MNSSPNAAKSNTANPNPFAEKQLFHADNIIHNRINLFFVAESIFFAAFVSTPKHEFLLKILLCVLGLVFTGSLWYAIARMKKCFEFLANKVVESQPTYREQVEVGGNQLSSFWLFTWLLPPVMFLAWLLLLMATLCRSASG